MQKQAGRRLKSKPWASKCVWVPENRGVGREVSEEHNRSGYFYQNPAGPEVSKGCR